MPVQIVQAAPSELPPAILRLATEPDRITRDRIWRALSEDERTAAATRHAANEAAFRARMVGYVARALHFRPETIARWPIERSAKAFSRVPFREADVLGDLIVEHHAQHAAMMSSFLDFFAVEHENGRFEDPDLLYGMVEDDPDGLDVAADSIASEYPLRDVVLYIASLVALDYLPRTEAGRWLIGRVADPVADPVLPNTAGEEEEVEPAAEPGESDTFTKLDKSLIYTIINSAGRIEGALTEEELDDLIDEVVHLNRDRQRTFFHVGYRDAVFGRDLPSVIEAPNAQRLHWYWAGAIQGLTRQYRWNEIVALYDAHPIVRELGQTAEGPCDAASPWIVTALIDCGRAVEIPQFLSPAGARQVRVPGLLHQEGSRLLRQDRAAEARGLYELLNQMIAGYDAEGVDTRFPLFLEMRRRFANCLRQLDDFHAARSILESLLAEESDPEVLARVHADLGLIDGGFRRLSEVRLPAQKDQVPALVERLERGRARFTAAFDQKTKSSAHARYCLGVLALAGNRPDEAIPHLEMAFSRFSEAPDRYAADRLIAQSGLYLAIAICLSMQAERVEVAVELLERAVKEGAIPPAWLVVDVLEGIGLPDTRLQARMAETLVNTDGVSLDGIIASSESLASPAVVAALLGRARSGARNTHDRLADYHRLLPWLLAAGRVDEAGEALDFMEEAASRGIDDERFLALLAQPRAYEPAWDHQAALDGRVGVLEARQRYDEAAQLLIDEFHRVLSRDQHDAVDEAEGLLGIVCGYPVPPEITVGPRGRLEACSNTLQPEEALAAVPSRPVRILFVGGDERQRMAQSAVRDQLRRSYPHIDVTFVTTGWSSNWASTLEDVCRKLPDHDAVVVMRFMRTLFGRRLRKEIEKPWRHCYGAGQKQMLGAVLAAARAAG